jgi:hypothetical protein
LRKCSQPQGEDSCIFRHEDFRGMVWTIDRIHLPDLLTDQPSHPSIKAYLAAIAVGNNNPSSQIQTPSEQPQDFELYPWLNAFGKR